MPVELALADAVADDDEAAPPVPLAGEEEQAAAAVAARIPKENIVARSTTQRLARPWPSRSDALARLDTMAILRATALGAFALASTAIACGAPAVVIAPRAAATMAPPRGATSREVGEADAVEPPLDPPEPPSPPSPVAAANARATAIAFSRDGALVAIADERWSVRVVDRRGAEQARFAAPGLVTGFVWSPDRARLAAETHTGAIVWDVLSGTTLARAFGDERTAREPFRAIKIAPDLSTVALLRDDGAVDLVDLATGDARHSALPPAARLVGFVGETALLATERARTSEAAELVIDRADVSDDARRASVILPGGHVARTSEGGRFAIVEGASTARVVDLAKGRVTIALPRTIELAVTRDKALSTRRWSTPGCICYPNVEAHVVDLATGGVGPKLGAVRRGMARGFVIGGTAIVATAYGRTIALDAKNGASLGEAEGVRWPSTMLATSPLDDAFAGVEPSGRFVVVTLADALTRARPSRAAGALQRGDGDDATR